MRYALMTEPQQGLSYEEIAAALGVPRGTVESLKRYDRGWDVGGIDIYLFGFFVGPLDHHRGGQIHQAARGARCADHDDHHVLAPVQPRLAAARLAVLGARRLLVTAAGARALDLREVNLKAALANRPKARRSLGVENPEPPGLEITWHREYGAVVQYYVSNSFHEGGVMYTDLAGNILARHPFRRS